MRIMLKHRLPARRATACAMAAAIAIALLASSHARATEQVVIRDARPPIGYAVELEPQLVLGTDPPGAGAGSGGGIGVRASFVLSPQGFIRGVNDSVAVGVGLDWGHYSGAWGLNGYRDECLTFQPGPNGTSVCTQVTSNGGSYNYLFVPVVMQWNFWLTQRFSAFGEPGLNLYFLGSHGFDLSPALFVGARFQITERLTVTARVGYPTVGIGVSFML